MSDKCSKCGTKLKCMAGRSAHPSNWYCHSCDVASPNARDSSDAAAMMVSWSYMTPRNLPQDVEEFIADKGFFHDHVDIAISAADLRAWMAGHVRVPVDPSDQQLEDMVVGFIREIGEDCQTDDPWEGMSDANKKEAIMECGRCIKAAIRALNESKGESS